MKFVFFVHSLISDWNHGNAHFLRGIVSELIARKHTVESYEPENSWSYRNLIKEYGNDAAESFHKIYPNLKIYQYKPHEIKLEEVLKDADVVIVHEWNDYELVYRIGLQKKTNGSFKLFFHDTHHRAVTDPESISLYDLTNYDGVLAFGEVIRKIYKERCWAENAWTWHEAADTRIFKPLNKQKCGDVVWIGNWGDEERSTELGYFLFKPIKDMNLRGQIYGVRYPSGAIEVLKDSGLEYKGWIPNYKVPEVFSRFKLTIHVPRRPYVEMLPGIPTIRPFEAMACGIPLICSPWEDTEGLFTAGKDYLTAKNGNQMKEYMKMLLNDNEVAEQLVSQGLKTIKEKHTCSHRVDQLLKICAELGMKNTGVKSQTDSIFVNQRGSL